MALAAFAAAGADVALPDAAVYLREPDRYGEQISPDGTLIAYLAPEGGGSALWVCGADGPGAARRMSAEGEPAARSFFWVEGGAALAWVAAERDGRTRLFTRRVAPDSEPREIDIPLPGLVSVEAVAATGAPRAILGVRSPARPFADLHWLDLATGEAGMLFANGAEILDWEIDARGRPRAGVRWLPDGSREVVAIGEGLAEAVCRAGPDESLRPIRLSPDGASLIVATDAGGPGPARIERIDLATGRAGSLAADPLARTDVEEVVMDPRDGRLLGAACWDGDIRWVFMDPGFARDFGRIRSRTGSEALLFRGFSRDGGRLLVEARDGGAPGELYLYDRARGDVTFLWKSRPSLPKAAISATGPITYPARDGTPIPGYLTLPNGGRAPHRLVVFPHGGPRMRSYGWFDGRVQFLASRGLAVFQPNYRGSRGYGKSFLNAGDRQWGTGVMQGDITDGVDHLIRRGIADRGRVAILGGSYGGYAALAGLAFTPEVYAAGVSLFGPSDLVDFAERLPVRWLPLVGAVHEQLGDPRVEADRRRLRGQSPANFTDRIRAPVLIYQGGRDEIVRRSQSDRLVAAMRGCGVDVTYLVDPGEGHGFSSPEKEAAVYERIAAFLDVHLGAGGIRR